MSSGKRQLLVAATALILLIGIGAQQFLTRKTALDALPDLDFSGVETPVASKIRMLREQVERNPGSAAAWGKFAMNLDVHDFKRESIPCYKQAAKLDPSNFRWIYYTATILSELGSPEAIQWFEYCQASNPNYLPLHILNGLTLLGHGRLKDATQAYHSALVVNQNASHAYFGLARIALSQNDLASSRKHLLKALEINPEHGEVYSLLAEIYLKLGEPEKAAEAQRKSQQFPNKTRLIDPLYAEVIAEGVSSFSHLMRGQDLNNKQRYAEASREFVMSLKVKPRAEAHNGLGLALQNLGNDKEAAEHFQAAIALNPGYRDALNNLARTLYKMGHIEESIVKLKELKRLDPAYPDAYLNLGIYLMSLGRVSEAIEAFRQGLANAPFDIRIAQKLAWFLSTTPQATLRDGAEAVSLAEKVCELSNYRVPQNLDILAAAYAETRQYQKAVKTARQAQQLAISAGQLDLANGIRSRQTLYEMNRAYRVKRY